MVYCPKCGEQNPRNAKFCSNCGYELSKINIDSEIPRENDTHKAESQEPKKIDATEYRRLTGILCVIIGVFLIFLSPILFIIGRAFIKVISGLFGGILFYLIGRLGLASLDDR